MADELLVIGGGAVGCAIARELAPDYDVTLVEKEGIGNGASGRAAGLVTVATAYAGHDRIVDHALSEFQSFDGTHGFQFHPAPSVEFPSNRGPLPSRASDQRDVGVDVDYVSPDAAADEYPRLNVPAGGYLRFNRTGWVVPAEFTTALSQSAVNRGVTIETGTEVTGFTVNNGTVTGVETGTGSRSPDAIILAGGWQSPGVVDNLVDLPVRPYWTQCVELGADSDLSGIPMGWIPEADVYWRPTRSGTLLIGGGSSLIDDAEQAPMNESESFRERAADLFPEIVSETSGAHYVQGWAGVDGATPDSYPIIDVPPGGPENLVVATGFHGRGIMSAFTAGAAVRGTLEDSSFPTDRFAFDRFDSRSTDFEFVNVSA